MLSCDPGKTVMLRLNELLNCAFFQCDTPMHLAIRNKDVLIVDLLLSSGVPLDITDGKRQQPLHTAAATC